MEEAILHAAGVSTNKRPSSSLKKTEDTNYKSSSNKTVSRNRKTTNDYIEANKDATHIQLPVSKSKKSNKSGIHTNQSCSTLLYNAKPRELDSMYQKTTVDHVTTIGNSTIDSRVDIVLDLSEVKETQKENKKLFSSMPFSSMNLDKKLVDIIEKSAVNSNSGGMGLLSCTTIQSIVLPMLIDKRQDMLIKSQTGSGKTMAYLVPIINDLIQLVPKVTRNDGCKALIMAPTRELCTQISEVLQKLTQCCVYIVSGCITGGERRKSEKGRLRKGINILVGTPGRLLDHLTSTESFQLLNLRWMVLDEVDRLLDMGFEQTVLQIVSIIRGEKISGLKETSISSKGVGTGNNSSKGIAMNLKQRWEMENMTKLKQCSHSNDLVLLMCSATLTKAVKQLALPLLGNKKAVDDTTNSGKNYLQKCFVVIDADSKSIDTISSEKDMLELGKIIPVASDINNNNNNKSAMSSSLLEKDELVETPSQLSQYFMIVTCKWRLAALFSFLKIHANQKVVVFFSTCDAVDYTALILREMEWPLELDHITHTEQSNQQHISSFNLDESEDKLGFQSTILSPNAKQSLEPIDCTFTGMLGPKRQIYRLHGNIPQQVRKTVYQKFCNAESGILLCTDVAARGLDLPNVDWILQYDPPCETTDYVHRIGRTARRGRNGCALLFLLPSEAAYLPLLSAHSLLPEPLSLQSLFLEAAKHIPGASKFKNTDEMSAVILQRRVEHVVHDNKWLLFAGRQTFRSYIRAYATHSTDTKGIFNVQSLHLGHVAKSFALRESPKNLRSSEDILGKIFNGAYSALNASNIKQQNRNQAHTKRKSSSSSVEGSVSMIEVNKKQRNDNTIPLSLTQNPGVVVKTGKDKQKLRKMSSTTASASHSSSNHRSSNSTMTNSRTTSNNKSLTASGIFRKTTGYFKKKLRLQSSSEFSS